MRYLSFIFLFVAARQSFAQVGPGLSAQVYPAGQILQAQATVSATDDLEWSLFAGYNRTRRMDFGVKDDERGGGPGIGSDVKWFVFPGRKKWFVGSKIDTWFMSIDWKDTIDPCGDLPCLAPVQRIYGQTKTIVVQPTAEIGYRAPMGPNATLDLTVAFGREINVHTRGEAVGEGLILLGGLALRF